MSSPVLSAAFDFLVFLHINTTVPLFLEQIPHHCQEQSDSQCWWPTPAAANSPSSMLTLCTVSHCWLFLGDKKLLVFSYIMLLFLDFLYVSLRSKSYWQVCHLNAFNRNIHGSVTWILFRLVQSAYHLPTLSDCCHVLHAGHHSSGSEAHSACRQHLD